MNVGGAAGAGTSWDQAERMLVLIVSVGSLTEFPIWSRPRACSRAASLQTQMARRTMSADVNAGRYDGTCSFPDSDVPAQTPAQRVMQLTVTAVLVAGP